MSDPGIAEAARLIRNGGLVAFPTETVYGLGANALDAEAVERIYVVKGRPAASPLIVHVADMAMARELAAEWPEIAEKLGARFWPGPLTLVVRKNSVVPGRTTAGLGTVGLRMPDHPVALDLIRAAGVPIAAPSANPFMAVSPTASDHVRRGLPGVDMVLEGGDSRVGIESTVLDLSGSVPVLLRPGMIGKAEIEAVIGSLLECAKAVEDGAHASPGMHPRHYSPKTPLVVVRDLLDLPRSGRGAVLSYSGRLSVLQRDWQNEPMPPVAAEYAADFYARLHELDGQGLDWIAVEELPAEPEWEAIRDRLQRAAARY